MVKGNEALAHWLNACDAVERAGDQLQQAIAGDLAAGDYTAKQLARCAAECLRAIYQLDEGLQNPEAQAIAQGVVKLTTGVYHITKRHESTGERRGT